MPAAWMGQQSSLHSWLTGLPIWTGFPGSQTFQPYHLPAFPGGRRETVGLFMLCIEVRWFLLISCVLLALPL